MREINMDFYKNIPKMVLLEITTKCNLSCSYCIARRLVKNPSDLPIEQIIELKDKLLAFDYIALCGLGESLIHKNFYQILEIFSDRKIVLVTNGSVPIDYERLMAYNNVDAVSFSVDGASENEMKRVCSRYRFDTLLENLENSIKHSTNVAFNCTLVRENISELKAMQEMAIKYKIKRFKIGLPLGQAKWVKANFAEINNALCELEKGMKAAGVDYEGPFDVKCIFDNAPIAVVSKNGNVYPCCDYYCSRPQVGNLFHNDFQTMWGKRSYKEFRTGCYCSKCMQYHNIKNLICSCNEHGTLSFLGGVKDGN